jgi:hypothetical protein
MIKGTKLEDLMDVLVIWIGQLHTNNEPETYEVIKEQAKVLGQQISVTNFVYKNLYVQYLLEYKTPRFTIFNFQENTNIHISQVFMSLIVCIFNVLELNNHLS